MPMRSTSFPSLWTHENVMFLLRACGQSVRGPRIASGLHTIRHQAIRLSTLGNSASRLPQAHSWLLQHQGTRLASNTGQAYRYPENLNVFNSGTTPVVTYGFLRIFCAVVAVYGVCIFAPGVYQDPAAPWYLGPVIAVGAALPLLVTGVAFGGYVHHINLLLPKTARKTQSDLTRFVSNMPPNAIVQVKSMWFRPWPVTKNIYFEDFKRLRQSKVSLSNLESAPPSVTALKSGSNPMSYWLARKIFGTYFVNMNMRTDRSRAPGVWKTVWEQIPLEGQRSVVKEGAEKRAVLASNRPVPVARQGRGPSKGILEQKQPPRASTSRSTSTP